MCGNVIRGETDVANANIVELEDQLMLVSGRSADKIKNRRLSYSADGIDWSTPEDATIEFADVFGCRFQGATVVRHDGSLAHFTPINRKEGQNEGDENGFVKQQGKKVYKAPNFASGLNVTVSTDKGLTWSTLRTVTTIQTTDAFSFLSGYMDAIVLDDGSILCVTEGGVVVPYEGLVSFKYN